MLLMNNAEVIFCDVDETTGIITAEELKKNNILKEKNQSYMCSPFNWKSGKDERN